MKDLYMLVINVYFVCEMDLIIINVRIFVFFEYLNDRLLNFFVIIC